MGRNFNWEFFSGLVIGSLITFLFLRARYKPILDRYLKMAKKRIAALEKQKKKSVPRSQSVS